MSQVLSFGRLESSPSAGDKAPTPESPFRIALLGDFSGRANRGEQAGPAELLKRKPRKVTRDNLDEVLAKLKVSLRLPLPDGDTVTLTFAALDDFHPDEIYDKVEKFEDLDDSDEKSVLMNGLLHHPDLQALESAWRGLDWLLRRILKVDSRIEVLLYDLTQDELTADLSAADDLASTALYKLLIEDATQGPKGEAWALLVGNYTFDVSAAHAEVLGRLAKIARQASVPFLADAHPRLLDKDFTLEGEEAQAWDALRQLPEAALLGLALPRFLLRPPYGERTKSIDRFSYEEFPRGAGKDSYLWGSAALACTALLGQSFDKQGWAFKPGALLDLENMSVHVYTDEDDDEQVTLAEAWLNRPVVERLVKQGFMPFLCVKGKNALQVFRFLSLAQPPKGQPSSELLGRWGQKGMVQLPRSGRPPISVGVSLGGGAVPPPPAPAARDGQSAAAESEAAAPAAEEAEAPPEEQPAAPAEEAMDPELAALLAQMETPAEAPAEPPPAEEAMDPELAALLAQMEAPAEPPPEETPPAAPAEEMDPELAALMKQMEGEAAAAEPAPAPAEEPMDDELAALMKQMEGETAAEAPAPEPAAPAEEMDPDLAALLAQMEGDTAAAAPPPEPEASDAQSQIDALGGRQALEDLGWPMFVPGFAEDLPRQLHILQNNLVNRAVDKEVKDLARACGGYDVLQAEGIAVDQGRNAQLAALRALKGRREREAALHDPDLAAMAQAYGASLKVQKTDADKADLLARVKEFDKWSSDPRNADLVSALEGTRFAERRQVQLEQQLKALGGDQAYLDWVAAHPQDGGAAAKVEQKVALLKSVKEYHKLGGEEAYLAKAAGAQPKEGPLAGKLDQLKAILAAQE